MPCHQVRGCSQSHGKNQAAIRSCLPSSNWCSQRNGSEIARVEATVRFACGILLQLTCQAEQLPNAKSDGYVSTVLQQRALARDGFVKLEGKHIHMDMDMQSSLCSVPISPRDLP